MQGKTAVVLGATGLTGSRLVQELTDDDEYSSIVLLVRKDPGIRHPKISIRITDFTDENDVAEKMGTGDVIFCCVGTTRKKVNNDKTAYRKVDYDIPVTTARLGISRGFNQYVVVSAVGANSVAANFYLQLKGSMEEDIAAYPYKSIHIFQPSVLLGPRKEKRNMESFFKYLMQGLQFLLIGGLRKYRPVSDATLARAMIRVTKTSREGVNFYEFDEIVKAGG